MVLQNFRNDSVLLVLREKQDGFEVHTIQFDNMHGCIEQFNSFDLANTFFKALKEIDNPKSKLSNGKKAANLRDALHDYLEYKRLISYL